MTQTQFLVFTSPVSGREDEYNDWYDNTHLREVTAIPGITGAKRFELVPGPLSTDPPTHRYLAIYDFEGEPEDIAAEFTRRGDSGEMFISESLDLTNVITGGWRPRQAD